MQERVVCAPAGHLAPAKSGRQLRTRWVDRRAHMPIRTARPNGRLRFPRGFWWSPGETDAEQQSADIVNLGFVLNVIEDPNELRARSRRLLHSPRGFRSSA